MLARQPASRPGRHGQPRREEDQVQVGGGEASRQRIHHLRRRTRSFGLLDHGEALLPSDLQELQEDGRETDSSLRELSVLSVSTQQFACSLDNITAQPLQRKLVLKK